MLNKINKLMGRELPEADMESLLSILRKMSVGEIAELYKELELAYLVEDPLPDLINGNTARRRQRHHDYVRHLRRIAESNASLFPKTKLITDLGCGDGEVSIGVFPQHEVQGCDVVNYLTEKARKKIIFFLQPALDFLTLSPNDSLEIVMENVMLHHLPTKSMYIEVIKQMLRTLKPGGIIMLTETIHEYGDNAELFRNALLDIYLNDLTSLETNGHRMIPVPVQFLSEKELESTIHINNGRIIGKIGMEKTHSDPKRHITYIITK